MKLRAYRFETDFGRAPPPAPEIVPPVEVFTEDQVEERVASAVAKAEKSAYENGYLSGRREASREFGEKFNETLSELKVSIDGLLTREDQAYEDLQRQAARILTAVFEKIAERLSAEEVRRSVEVIIERALHATRANRKLTLFASGENASRLSDALTPRIRGLVSSGRIAIEMDQSLAGDAVRLDWTTGGVEFDPGGRAEQVQTILRAVSAALDGGDAD